MARDTKIKDVERKLSGFSDNPLVINNDSEGCIPKDREAIATYVDEPCVEACKLLYDLNIRTVNSGANVDGEDNIKSKAFIGIDYNSLSPENKVIADAMEEVGLIEKINRNPNARGYNVVVLEVNITSNSTVGEISDRLLTFAKFFRQQDVLFGRETRKDIEKFFRLDKDGNYFDNYFTLGTVRPEKKEELIRLHFSDKFLSEDGYYYVSEDLLNKHNEYRKTLQESNQK